MIIKAHLVMLDLTSKPKDCCCCQNNFSVNKGLLLAVIPPHIYLEFYMLEKFEIKVE